MRRALLLAILTAPALVAGDPLHCGLYELEEMRDGFRSGDLPPDALEKQGAKLLAICESKADRAEVHGRLAHVYAQTDIRKHAEIVEKYAALALEQEKDALRRARLHSYRGDAAIVRNEPHAKTRAAAAEHWLAGYKETVALRLPEKAPQLPGVDRVGEAIANGGIEAAQARIRLAAQMEARRVAEFERDMVRWRDVFVRQLVENYARKPLADAELRKAAVRILGDEKAADELVGRVIRN